MGDLTAADVELIKKMWTVLDRNLYDVGDVMLFKFFEKYPNYKQRFPKFRNTPLDQLKGQHAFRCHAYQIMVQFTTSINLLGEPGGVEKIRELWRAHGTLHANLNVKKSQFNEVRDVIITVILEICNLTEVEEIRIAWNKLFDVVYAFSFETMYK